MLQTQAVKVISFTLFVVAMVVPADAQVSARQGERDRTRFESPMILDLPLTAAKPEFWDKGQLRSKDEVMLRDYSCDGVSFVDFASRVKRQRDRNVKITFDFVLATEPGIDKLASIKIMIMAGDREVAARVHNDIDAEEGKQSKGQVVIVLPETILKADPVPTLRIQLKVVDNP